MSRSRLTFTAIIMAVTLAPVAYSQTDPVGSRVYGTDYNYFPDIHLNTQDLFAPVKPTPLGGDDLLNTGWFFNYDYAALSIKPPKLARVGIAADLVGSALTANVAVTNTSTLVTGHSGPGFAPVNPVGSGTQIRSSLDTSAFTAEPNDGSEFEIGFMSRRTGGSFRGFYTTAEQQTTIGANGLNIPPGANDGTLNTISAGVGANGAFVVFTDPLQIVSNLGTLAIKFNGIQGTMETEVRNGEFMLHWRPAQSTTPYKAGWEFMAGPRYMLFDESWNVDADFLGSVGDADPTTISSHLPQRLESFWNTQAENHLFGLQLGTRFFRRYGGWNFGFDARGGVAYNHQVIYQHSEIDPEIFGHVSVPPILHTNPAAPSSPHATSVSNREKQGQVSPMAGVRTEVGYQITRLIRLRATYRVDYIGNIARPSRMVEYAYPYMGIDEDEQSHIFSHGIMLGMAINR